HTRRTARRSKMKGVETARMKRRKAILPPNVFRRRSKNRSHSRLISIAALSGSTAWFPDPSSALRPGGMETLALKTFDHFGRPGRIAPRFEAWASNLFLPGPPACKDPYRFLSILGIIKPLTD